MRSECGDNVDNAGRDLHRWSLPHRAAHKDDGHATAANSGQLDTQTREVDADARLLHANWTSG